MKNIRITITMTEKEAEWLEQACFVEEDFEHSKFLNHVSNLARRARHAFQQSVQRTAGDPPEIVVGVVDEIVQNKMARGKSRRR